MKPKIWPYLPLLTDVVRFKCTHILIAFSVTLTAVLGSTVVAQRASGSETVEVQIGRLNVLLPTSITITGTEIGLSERSCLFSVVITSKPNEFIPLRGGARFSLEDSIGTSIDSGYYEAFVEDINRVEAQGVFRCNNTNGTLKPPYIFRVAPFGRSDGDEKKVSVTVNFVKPTPTPTPQFTTTTKPSPTPKTTPPPSVELGVANEVLKLQSQIALLQSQVRTLNGKLKKICSAKPKPKGC